MNVIIRIIRPLVSMIIFFLMTTLYAGGPIWTFVPSKSPKMVIPANSSDTITYTVTNHSKKPHSLKMKPIRGISASGNCSAPIEYPHSCTLILQITGSQLQGDVIGGPVLCQNGSSSQCYQPSQNNSLNITLKKALYYTITPSSDGNGVITPDTPQTVALNGSISFLATPNSNFTVYQWLVDGEIKKTGGANYTLSNITANHTVKVTFTSKFAAVSVLPTTLNIPTGSARSVVISNDSPIVDILNLNIGIASGSGTVTPGLGSTCTSTLAANSSCTYFFQGVTAGTATATISGSNTSAPAIVNLVVSGTPPTTTLTTSTLNLALSVQDTSTNAALTGTPRKITITNSGMNTAQNVSYNPSPGLPTGTTITPSTCGTIEPSDSCTLTITPGVNPSAIPGDTNPTPITLNIEGDNTNTLSPTINILTYGSVYQSGFVFDVDDTKPDTVSISGKVAAQTDQASTNTTGIYWDSNPACTAFPPTCSTTTATSDSDGANNTTTIYNVLTGPGNGEPANTFAAGLCYGINIGGYIDWYLPAICEMGYDDNGATTCGKKFNPKMQNIVSNLVDNNIGSISGDYWTSTEDSDIAAFFQNIAPTSTQGQALKGGNLFGVRCARVLTP